MRWVIATALLVVLSAMPVLALLCEARCAAPYRQSHARAAGGATHAHHAHAVPARRSDLQAPNSGLQASGVLRNCTPYMAADVVAPERVWPVCGSPEASDLGLAATVRGSASHLLRVFRPPLLVPRPSAPLRI